MRIAFSTLQYGPIPNDFLGILDEIAAAGFKSVEIAQRLPDLGLSPARLKSELDRRGLTVAGLLFGTVEERVSWYLELRAGYLLIDHWNEGYGKLLEEGIVLALHPGAFRPIGSLSEANDLLAKHTSLMIIIDLGHMLILNEDIQAAVEMFSERVVSIHLKDWTPLYGRSFRRYQSGFCPIGEGDVKSKIPAFLRRLDSSKFNGWLVAEVEPQKFEASESPAATAARLPSLLPHDGRQMNQMRAMILDRNMSFSDRALSEFLHLLSQITDVDLDAFLQLLPNVIARLIPAGLIALYVIDPLRAEMHLVASNCASGSNDLMELRIRLSETASGVTLQNKLVVQRFSLNEANRIAIKMLDKSQNVVNSNEWWCIPIFNTANLSYARMLFEIFPKNPLSLSSTDGWFVSKAISVASQCVLNRQCDVETYRVEQFGGGFRDFQPFLATLIVQLQEVLSCEGLTIFLVDADGSKLRASATTGITWDGLPESDQFYAKGEGATGTVWESKCPMIAFDCAEETVCSRKSGERVETSVSHHCLWVPWVSQHTGEVVAIVRARNRRNCEGLPQVFSSDHICIAEAIGDAALPYIEKVLADHLQNAELGSLSHEIKDVVGFMRGAARNISKESSSLNLKNKCDDIANWAKLISHEIYNADLFRNWATKSEPSLTFVSPNRVFREALAACSQILVKHNTPVSDIDISAVATVKTIRTDEELFCQIVFNLLANSIVYHHPSLPAEVKICVGYLLDQIVFDFLDWGVGLDKFELGRVFDPGFRSPTAHKYHIDGEGLGLWVAKSLSASLRGKIEIKSLSSPTVIRLSLPFSSGAQSNANGMPDAHIWPEI